MAPVALGDVAKLHEGLAGGGADHVLESKSQLLGDRVPVDLGLLAEIDGRNLHLKRMDEQNGKCGGQLKVGKLPWKFLPG